MDGDGPRRDDAWELHRPRALAQRILDDLNLHGDGREDVLTQAVKLIKAVRVWWERWERGEGEDSVMLCVLHPPKNPNSPAPRAREDDTREDAPHTRKVNTLITIEDEHEPPQGTP